MLWPNSISVRSALGFVLGACWLAFGGAPAAAQTWTKSNVYIVQTITDQRANPASGTGSLQASTYAHAIATSSVPLTINMVLYTSTSASYDVKFGRDYTPVSSPADLTVTLSTSVTVSGDAEGGAMGTASTNGGGAEHPGSCRLDR